MREIPVIVGPTASGKTAAALALAKLYPVEIISCDSVQLYRGLDIGSAKVSPAIRACVPHHMIDILAPSDPYDAALYAGEARRQIEAVISRGAMPLVVGGSGLYLRALMGEDFELAAPRSEALRSELEKLSNQDLKKKLEQEAPAWALKIHLNDRYRLIRQLERSQLPAPNAPQELAATWAFRLFVLSPARAKLHHNIAARTQVMLEQGLEKELEGLLAQGWDPGLKAFQSIGYKQVLELRAGLFPRALLAEKIMAATRQYAKRQDTWNKKLRASWRGENPADLIQALADFKKELAILEPLGSLASTGLDE